MQALTVQWIDSYRKIQESLQRLSVSSGISCQETTNDSSEIRSLLTSFSVKVE
jgi:hypothetical protein